MDATYPPFESVDPKGEIVGWEVDYGNALCAKMKVTCTFQNQDWDGIIPALLAGKFDVILSSMNDHAGAREEGAVLRRLLRDAAGLRGTGGDKSDDVSPAALKGKTIGTPVLDRVRQLSRRNTTRIPTSSCIRAATSRNSS